MFHFERTLLTDGYDTRTQDRMMDGMRSSLNQLVNGQMCVEDAITYITSLIEQQEESGHWSVLPDWHAPSDVRVMYIYQPTYLATAFLMTFLLRYPSVCYDISGFFDGLSRGLEASAGRNFLGSFGDEQTRYDVMDLFLRAGLRDFMQAHVEMCPLFSQMIRQILLETRIGLDSELVRLNSDKSGVIQNFGESPEYWRGVTFRALSSSLLEEMTGMMIEQGIDSGTLVFVYGTLMTGCSNHAGFLADSIFVGSGTLHGYALYDIGYYPGIKQKKKEIVKGELYLVNSNTLMRLDSLEG